MARRRRRGHSRCPRGRGSHARRPRASSPTSPSPSTTSAPAPCSPSCTPRGRPRLTSAGQAREALGASLTDLTGAAPPPDGGPPPDRPAVLPRTRSAPACSCWSWAWPGVGWSLLSGDSTDRGTPGGDPDSLDRRRPRGVDGARDASRTRSWPASDFDPLGNGEENPGRVPFAYRRGPQHRVAHRHLLQQEPGQARRRDRCSTSVPHARSGRCPSDLVGNGTDLQVLTSNDAGGEPQDYDLMAQATEAGERGQRSRPRIRPQPRYVLALDDGPAAGGRWLAGRGPRGPGHQLTPAAHAAAAGGRESRARLGCCTSTSATGEELCLTFGN